MYATVGDQLLPRPIRDGEIVEVHGKDGQPPYLVRWSDTGHETLVFPGADALIRPTHQGIPSSDSKFVRIQQT
ncbi:MAG: DUF1918 domain-containing protein [Mycobacterium sp.]|nr:DUF1918 domain-containing protein [Mycobacterium sp.]